MLSSVDPECILHVHGTARIVSGGMAGKISAAATTASRGIPVYIVKGGSSGMLEACLGNQPSEGTLIKPPTTE